jgi:hypothetical protein
MDFEERLRDMPVGAFIHTLQNSPFYEYGPHSINRRVCGYLSGAYGSETSMWDVVVDGPPVWHLTGGCGPKIIEALAKAINIEMGAQIVPTALPTKERREEGYFWTKERLTEAAQMLDGGSSYREVSLHYGRSVDGMKAALKRYGMHKPRFSGNWHPIKTAPKDGTVIIAYGQYSSKPGVQTHFCQTAAWEANELKAGWSNASGSWLGDVTHWMPLPPPPK